MITVTGAHNSAKVFTSTLEAKAEQQILAVCNRPEFAHSKIRIMPDVHAGMGCTIGTTMTITNKVVPGMVGVDIGCGMETVKLAERDIDFVALDQVIRRNIPSGQDVRRKTHPLNRDIDLKALRCTKHVNLERASLSIGTLGGGNHFIEVGRNEDGELYLVVHSGSRHIGNQVAKYYQDLAWAALNSKHKQLLADAIAQLKADGRDSEIENVKQQFKRDNPSHDIPKDLAYCEGALFDDYMHDMKIIQRFATLNRMAMTQVILEHMQLTELERFTTIHNYIDTDEMILRKGAVSAKAGQRLLVPINMRDGSLICVGKGNDDWNQSAPHGAGRLMSRTAAKQALSMDEYAAEMQGVFTTCVDRRTLDEAPMAYKPMAEIVAHITPTADIVERLLPVYNFKASE
ncbi:MAG: RtcB family protein [Oscillospiraceae bacterium]|nr:RtcB family protein [Oscillospiraceae bacterium]